MTATINTTITLNEFRPNYSAIVKAKDGAATVGQGALLYLAVAAIQLGDIKWSEARGGSFGGFTELCKKWTTEGFTMPIKGEKVANAMPNSVEWSKITRVIRHHLPEAATMSHADVTAKVRAILAEYGSVSGAYDAVPTTGGQTKKAPPATRGAKSANELMAACVRQAKAESMDRDTFLALAAELFDK